MGGQWEAVVCRSLRELPPRYTRHRPPTLCTLLHTRAYTYIRIVCMPYACSCSVRRVELVDDPGDVNDFHGKFSPPKMAKLAPLAGVSRTGARCALINGLAIYIYSIARRRSLVYTLERNIYETESTDCAGKNIRNHRPVSAIFHDWRTRHWPGVPADSFALR